MDETEKQRQLQAAARGFGWSLAGEAAQRLLHYLDAMLDMNRRLNLTGVRDPGEAFTRHLVDSLAFGLDLVDRGVPAPPHVLDLGTGGGFPGIPAAVACPTSTVHLVESRGRKLEAVMSLAAGCGITNVAGHTGRLAALLASGTFQDRGPGLVLARAVAPLQRLVREVAGLLPPGGVLVCWKSSRLEAQEREQGAREAARRGLCALPEIAYRTDRDGLLARYRKGPA